MAKLNDEQISKTIKEAKELDPVDQKLIKSSMYLELHKFKIKEELQTNDNSLVWDFNVYELRAINAIQKLLYDTDFKGHRQDIINSSIYNLYDFKRPILEISFTEYYKAFEIKPDKNGKYQGYEANLAIDALKSLVKLRKISYKKPTGEYNKKGEPLHYDVKGEVSLINVLFAYPEDKSKKIASIIIIPSPIFVEAINRFYCLKTRDLYTEIKSILPAGSKVTSKYLNFITYLQTLNTPTHKIRIENLAQKLQMNSYIEKRQWQRVKEEIQKCIDIALKLKYLLKANEKEGCLYLTLNPERCKRIKTNEAIEAK
jgi:hypothetical protein